LLQGNLIILSVLLMLYAFSYYQTYGLRSQFETLQKQRMQRSQQLLELQQKYPPKIKDPRLATQVRQKQALLDHRHRLIRELQHQNTGAGGNPGFSEQLSGLARQDKQNIWLDQISVRDGKQLTLLGHATSPEAVPLFIQRLTTEPSFSGTKFSRVQISRDENNPSIIGFSLKTETGEKEGTQ
jgi:hypothetical protein